MWDSIFARGTEICDGRFHLVEEIVCILVENGSIEGRNPQVFLCLCLWSQIWFESIWLERRFCTYVAGIRGQERICGISEVLWNASGMYLNRVNS